MWQIQKTAGRPGGLGDFRRYALKRAVSTLILAATVAVFAPFFASF